MRSAVELAQDSILSSPSSTSPAVPALSIPPQVSRSSVCSSLNLIVDGIRANALLVEITRGLGSDRALVHDTGSHIKCADGWAQAAAQFLMVADPVAMSGHGVWCRRDIHPSVAPGNWLSKCAVYGVRVPVISAAVSMT